MSTTKSTAPEGDAPVETVFVQLLATIEPTPTDRTRYPAFTVWAMPIDRAEALIDDGLAELTDAPDATPEVSASFALDEE